MLHLSVPVVCIHSFLFIFLLLILETSWPDLCKTNRTFQENLLIWYKFLGHRSPSANVLDLFELSCCLCDSSCLTGLLRNMEFSVIPSKIISFLDIQKSLCTSCQDFLPDWLLQGKCLLLLLPAPGKGWFVKGYCWFGPQSSGPSLTRASKSCWRLPSSHKPHQHKAQELLQDLH